MKRGSQLLTLPVLLALGVLLFLSLRKLDRTGAEVQAAAEETPRYELSDAQWTRTTEEGTVDFVARAARLSWYDDESARLQQAELVSLGGSGSPWRLTAPAGRMPPGSRDLMLSGMVLVRGRWPDGSELGLHTERLWVDPAARLLHTDADVALEGVSRNAMATGLSADFDGKHVRLLSRVRAQYEARPPAQEKPSAPGL